MSLRVVIDAGEAHQVGLAIIPARLYVLDEPISLPDANERADHEGRQLGRHSARFHRAPIRTEFAQSLPSRWPDGGSARRLHRQLPMTCQGAPEGGLTGSTLDRLASRSACFQCPIATRAFSWDNTRGGKTPGVRPGYSIGKATAAFIARSELGLSGSKGRLDRPFPRPEPPSSVAQPFSFLVSDPSREHRPIRGSSYYSRKPEGKK